MRTLGIVGCGAIGVAVAEGIHANFGDSYALGYFSDADALKAEQTAGRFGGKACPLQEVVDNSDIILEATTARVMPGVIRTCLNAKKPCVVMSVGGFVFDSDLLEEVEESRNQVYLPSGAISGLDGVVALRELGLEEVSLTTCKHPRSLTDIPYLEEKGIDLSTITAPVTLFEGPASMAIRNFPSNVNVAITLSLAGIGFSRTVVRLVADPRADHTRHTVFARAGACQVTATIVSDPLPQNPKSSRMAVESAFAVFRRLVTPLRAGT